MCVIVCEETIVPNKQMFRNRMLQLGKQMDLVAINNAGTSVM